MQSLTLDTLVVAASPKTILREWRCFVVGGRVVAQSQYAAFGRRERSADVPAEVVAFAQSLVDTWQPAKCFVLDIGQTEAGLGMVEINTLNSSGVYECDFSAVVEALEDLYEGPAK